MQWKDTVMTVTSNKTNIIARSLKFSCKNAFLIPTLDTNFKPKLLLCGFLTKTISWNVNLFNVMNLQLNYLILVKSKKKNVSLKHPSRLMQTCKRKIVWSNKWIYLRRLVLKMNIFSDWNQINDIQFRDSGDNGQKSGNLEVNKKEVNIDYTVYRL